MPYLEMQVCLPPTVMDSAFRAAEIYSTLFESAPSGLVRHGNYNFYDARLSLRFDFCDVGEGARWLGRALEELANCGDLTVLTRQPIPWEEPDFVRAAHEAATKAAVKIIEQLRADNRLQTELLGPKRSFVLAHLLHLWLGGAGFTCPLIWGLKRESPYSKDEETLCAIVEGLSLDLRATPHSGGSFLERIIHTFLNCLGRLDVENEVLALLRTSLTWEEMGSRGS